MFKYIVQMSHVKSGEANQRRSEKVIEGRAQGASQTRLGRGGVKVREECTKPLEQQVDLPIGDKLAILSDTINSLHPHNYIGCSVCH